MCREREGEGDREGETERERQRGERVRQRERAAHCGSMRASMAAVKSSTTQEQLKAAPLCFSFSTEYLVSSSGSTKRSDRGLVCLPFRLTEGGGEGEREEERERGKKKGTEGSRIEKERKGEICCWSSNETHTLTHTHRHTRTHTLTPGWFLSPAEPR